MDHPTSPTQILYELIIEDPKELARIQSWWETPVMDYKRGMEVPQDRIGRIEDLRDAFYGEAEKISWFKSPFISKVFDALTDEIDWAELESLIHGGDDDE